jgi:hypothetical protein
MPARPVTGLSFTSIYVDDIRASQEAHTHTSMAYYGDSFTFLYVPVDDVRT